MMTLLRRPLGWAIAFVVIAALVVFLRRWIHHAQLESVPVIVPVDVPVTHVVQPPPADVAGRMLLEVRDLIRPPQRPRLAVLTFDDGPFPVTTPALLAQLQALRVPAAFFFIGRDAREQPAITLRAKQAGVELGNHSYSHPEMPKLSRVAQQAEIAVAAREITTLTGAQPTYFRPPHGNYDASTIEAARAQGETVALWDIDPGDWRTITSQEIASNVIGHARSPAVILLHNGKQATIEALPRIVRAYRDAGFEFVTLAQLQQRLPLDAINDPLPVQLGQR